MTRIGPMKLDGPIEYVNFLVWDRPFCLWAREIRKKSLHFIDGIDPDYYVYQSLLHKENLEGPTKLYAAMAIRTAYSHALETFLALLGAALQAPQCVFGWLLMYGPSDLDQLARAIRDGQPFGSRLLEEKPSWQSVCDAVLRFKDGGEKVDELRRSLADAWSQFGSDFLDGNSRSEYNSIKHGFRCVPGGFTLATKPADGDDTKWETVGKSEFGSSFFVAKKFETQSHHFRVDSTSHNWDPDTLRDRITLIATSLKNILLALRMLNGGNGGAVLRPTDETIWESAWKRTHCVFAINVNEGIELKHIKPFSKSEIRANY